MSIRSVIRKIRTDIRASYPSAETETLTNRLVIQPLGYFIALLLIRLRWTPGMAMLLSLISGIAGGMLLCPESLFWNWCAVALFILTDVFHASSDQIARLKGRSRARRLGVLSSTAQYTAVYVSLCLRLMDKPIPLSNGYPWGEIIWIVALVAALICQPWQTMMANYYRDIHLFFLDSTGATPLIRARTLLQKRAALPRKGTFFKRLSLVFYSLYVCLQELATPSFQRFYRGVLRKYDGNIPDALRADYVRESRHYIRWANGIAMSARRYALLLCVLLNKPLVYLLIEIVAFGLATRYIRVRYATTCEMLIQSNGLPGKETAPVKKKKYPIVFFLIGLVGIVWMLTTMDVSSIDSGLILRLMPIWLPTLLILWAVTYFIHAYASRIIMGESGRQVPLSFIYKLTLSGFAMNRVTPVGFMGGEPYRIMVLKPRVGVECATASVIMFTCMNMFANILYWLSGAVAYFILFGFSGGFIRNALMGLVLVFCVVILVVFFTRTKRGVVFGFFRLLAKFPFLRRRIAQFMEENESTIDQIDREITSFFQQKKRFWLTAVLEYLTYLTDVVEYMLIFRMLGAEVSFLGALIALVSASLIGNIMFFIPMQIGAREGGIALVLQWLSVPASYGVTAALLTRIREIFYVIVGVALMLMNGEPDASMDGESPALAPEPPAEA